ncbi:MAG: P1 family peptidase [Halobacteriota archaeon]
MKEIKIREIEGFEIGNDQDTAGGTGCTVIICRDGATAGVEVRGSAPATRETDLLSPMNKIEKINAVILSGGSAFGLDAAGGVMKYLEESGVGFETGFGVVPIVCGASLFDLCVGNPKARPDLKMGYAACMNARENSPKEGNYGAGTGATVGKLYGPDHMMKSGLGMFAAQAGLVKCGAIAAVNALGDVYDTDTGDRLAGILNRDMDGLGNTNALIMEFMERDLTTFRANTTLGCIITNARLTKVQCTKLAAFTQNGYARAISPVHTTVDGDTVFVMATGEVDAGLDSLGVLAADIMAKAIARAVLSAEPAYGLPAACSFK